MTIANPIVTLALNTAGALGVGQAPQQQDVNDSFTALNAMIGQWNRARMVQVIPGTLALFPDLTTDVPSWTGLENALIWNLSVRLRPMFGLPEDKQQTELAEMSSATLQANNKQFQPALHTGTPATPIQVIGLALRMAGRVTDTQSVTDSSQDVSDAFALLVTMLAEWSKERWLVFDEIDVACTSTGALSYSIGPSCDFSVTRVDRIESAFVRMPPPTVVTTVNYGLGGGIGDFAIGDDAIGGTPNAAYTTTTIIPAASPIDYPLDILGSREDYNLIGLKSLRSFPTSVFLDSGYPAGSVYVWPLPAAGQFEIHLSVKATLPTYATINDPLNLPAEYTQAIITNLACQIVLFSGKEPSQFLLGRARSTLQTLRKANLQVPRMQMPYGLPGGRRGAYGLGGIWGIGSFASAPSGASGSAPTLPAANYTIPANAILGADGAPLLGADGAILLQTISTNSGNYLLGADGDVLLGSDGNILTYAS